MSPRNVLPGSGPPHSPEREGSWIPVTGTGMTSAHFFAPSVTRHALSFDPAVSSDVPCQAVRARLGNRAANAFDHCSAGSCRRGGGAEDVGLQALIRGLDTAVPFVRPGLPRSGYGRRSAVCTAVCHTTYPRVPHTVAPPLPLHNHLLTHRARLAFRFLALVVGLARCRRALTRSQRAPTGDAGRTTCPIAQTKPASSRATAVTVTHLSLPLRMSLR